ncbi:hypothetical protein F5883DRAFT_441847 [Diaporthe sp. PMI_573]|nr:hypothetical protein F5883DRAFT_441847 [Diaporthaceae sp. PMI_573]
MSRVIPQDAAAAESVVAKHAKAPGQDVLYGSTDSSDEASVDDVRGRLGYESQLRRNRSTVHVTFMAFVLGANPYGLATTLNYPLIGGGPVNIIWGWLLVVLIVVCVAASLGEITSVYPTAGGVYHQAGMLSPPKYRPLASWICGWYSWVGNISITLSVNFGTAQFFAACLNVFETESGIGVFPNKTYQGFLIFVAMTLVCNAVSSFGNRWLPWIDVSSP